MNGVGPALCRNCGVTMNPEALFCPACGTPAAAPAARSLVKPVAMLAVVAVAGAILYAVLAGGSDTPPAASGDALGSAIATGVETSGGEEPTPVLPAEQLAAVDAAAFTAGCTPVTTNAEANATHVAAGTVFYSTNPPTSGMHRSTWYDTGVYETQLENEQQVHNLEHGHVIVQYRGVPAPTAAVLGSIADRPENRQWVLVAPKDDMAHNLALTAWGRIVTCPGVPELGPALDLTNRFIEAFRDRSDRESIPGTPRSVGATTAAP